MPFVSPESSVPWINQIISILNSNHLTLWDLVRNVLWHGHTVENISPHRESLSQNLAHVLDALAQVSENQFKSAAAPMMKEFYREEILCLVEKHHGLHFGANKASLEQLECFAIDMLSSHINSVCPLLSDLVYTLLDARGIHQHLVDTESDLEEEEVAEPKEDEGKDEGEESEESGGSQVGEENAGETSDTDSDVSMDNPKEENEKQAAQDTRHRRKQNRNRRHAKLMTVKHVLILSVLGHSTNQKFNTFQSFIGLFIESKQPPEIIVELVAHLGISVSSQSLRNMINSLSKKAKLRLKTIGHTNKLYDNLDFDFKKGQPTGKNLKDHWSATAVTFIPYKNINRNQSLRFVKELHETSHYNPHQKNPIHPQFFHILPKNEDQLIPSSSPNSLYAYLTWLARQILIEQGGSGFQAYKKELGEPFGIDVLPCDKKDVQYPGEIINADEGSYDGNADVIESIQTQSAVVDLEEFVDLFHGDLSTLERILGLKRARQIERSSKNRLDFIVFVLGLFHLKMAAADAYRRIHIHPASNRGENLGVNEYLNYLRPKATAEFTSKNGPSFRSMHDTIHHVLWTDILACFAAEIRSTYGVSNLKAFAESKPTWDQIVQLSHLVVQKYLPQFDFNDRLSKPHHERDFVFESIALRNQHGLLYIGLSRAMNYGDVGRILQLFPYYISIFTAVGKHKYATHMTRFLVDLNYVYPPSLRKAILQNWMYNEKGKPDSFRGLDWLQESNNLYTKVIFAGKGPNHTRQLIIKRSVLLPVYRSVQHTIEESCHLTHRTVHHSKPKMTNTLRRLGEYVVAHDGCDFKIGRTSSIPSSTREWVVQDAVNDGFALLVQKSNLYEVENDAVDDSMDIDVDGEDVGVE